MEKIFKDADGCLDRLKGYEIIKVEENDCDEATILTCIDRCSGKGIDVMIKYEGGTFMTQDYQILKMYTNGETIASLEDLQEMTETLLQILEQAGESEERIEFVKNAFCEQFQIERKELYPKYPKKVTTKEASTFLKEMKLVGVHEVYSDVDHEVIGTSFIYQSGDMDDTFWNLFLKKNGEFYLDREDDE